MKDVDELYQILTSNYTFDKENVILLKNPSRSQIFDSFELLSKKITAKDNFLIFYAGHGYLRNKIFYWLPVDAGNTPSNWFSNKDLIDIYLANLNTKHTLVISDACFSGAIGRDVNMELPKKLYESPSRTAMTSGNEEPVPNKSIFFEFLFKSLKNNTKKYFAASEIFVEIREKVFQSTQKLPQYGVIPGLDDRGGDFIFIRK